MCDPATVTRRDAIVRARGNMVTRLCAGLAVVCLGGAANAADLSMTPIYKSRPSMVSSLDGRLKDEYRTFDFIIPGLLDQRFVSATASRDGQGGPTTNRAQTGMNSRF